MTDDKNRFWAICRPQPGQSILLSAFSIMIIMTTPLIHLNKNNVVHAAVRSWQNVRRQATVEASIKSRDRSLYSSPRSLSTSSLATMFDGSLNPYFINETEHVKSAPTVYGVFVPPTMESPPVRRHRKLSSSLSSNYQQHSQTHAPFLASSSQLQPSYDTTGGMQAPATGGSSSADTPSGIPAYDDLQYYYEPPATGTFASEGPVNASNSVFQGPTSSPNVITLEEYIRTTTTTSTTTQRPSKKVSVAPFIPERRRGAGSGGGAGEGGQKMAPTHPTKKLIKPSSHNTLFTNSESQPPLDGYHNHHQLPQNNARDLTEVSHSQHFDPKQHDFSREPPITTNLDFPNYDESPAVAAAAPNEATSSSTTTVLWTPPSSPFSSSSSSTTGATTPRIFVTKRPQYKHQQTLPPLPKFSSSPSSYDVVHQRSQQKPLFPPTKSTTPFPPSNNVVETTDYTPLHIITHNKQPKSNSNNNNNNMLSNRRQAHLPPPPPQHTNVVITLHDILPSPQTPATTVMMHNNNNNPRLFLPPPGPQPQHPVVFHNNDINLLPPQQQTPQQHHQPQSKLFDEDFPTVIGHQPHPQLPSPPGQHSSPAGGGAFFPDEPYQQRTTFLIDAWAVPPPETFDCAAHGGIGYFADVLRDCYVFYHCKPDNTYERLTCPAGLRFDEQARACVEKDTVQCGHNKQRQQKQFDCNGKTGFYADPFAPGKSSYYFCWGNNPPQRYDCPPGLLFNANCGACDLPQNCGGQPIVSNNLPSTNGLNSQKSSAEVFNLNSHLQNNFVTTNSQTNQQLNINDIHDGPNDIARQQPNQFQQSSLDAQRNGGSSFNTLHVNVVDNDVNSKQINGRNHNDLLLLANPPLLPLSPPVPPLPIHTTFDCTGRYGLFADEHVSGCQSYWMCLPDGARHRLTCPPHLRFNEQLGTCDWPKNVACRNSGDNELFVNGVGSGASGVGGGRNIGQETSLNTLAARSACRDRVGFYADHGNHCKSYVYCSEDGKAFEYFCPPAQAYNETIGACEDSQRVQCYYQLAHDRAQLQNNNIDTYTTAHRMVLGPTAVDCSGKNGLYADPFHSCKVYYYCNYGKQVKLQCPPGQIFNDGKCSERKWALPEALDKITSHVNIIFHTHRTPNV